MAVSYNASQVIVNQSSANSTSVSVAVNCGVGSNRLLLAQSRAINNSVSAASYNGAGMTNAGSYSGLKMWRLIAPTTGSNTLTFTTSSTYTGVYASIASFNGVDQTTPLGTTSTAGGTSTAPSTVSITCPTDGAIYAGEYSQYAVAATAPTIASGTLAGAGASLGVTIGGGYRLTTGTVAWSIKSAPWEVQGFPINASAPPANPRNGDMNFMGI